MAAKKPAKGVAHKRTAANERVIRALVKANPEVTHGIIAEALGCSVPTVARHYADLIPHVGPGRPEHVPTVLSRQMVTQHKALGLKHSEIAGLLGLEKTTLEVHYKHELETGLASTKAAVGSMIVKRALSTTDKDAQRAGEFFMERMGGWVSRSKVGVGMLDPTDPENATLVGPSSATRGDARKVALLLAQARPVQVVANEPTPESPPGEPKR